MKKLSSSLNAIVLFTVVFEVLLTSASAGSLDGTTFNGLIAKNDVPASATVKRARISTVTRKAVGATKCSEASAFDRMLSEIGSGALNDKGVISESVIIGARESSFAVAWIRDFEPMADSDPMASELLSKVQPFVKQRFPNGGCSVIPNSFGLVGNPSGTVVKCSIPFCRGPADQPPVLAYGSTTHSWTVGQAVSIKPSVFTNVASISVNPSLPPGLNLDRRTGEIRGKPTSVSPNKTYVFTASGANGTAPAVTLNLQIIAAVSVKKEASAPTVVRGVRQGPVTRKAVGATKCSEAPEFDRMLREIGASALHDKGVIPESVIISARESSFAVAWSREFRLVSDSDPMATELLNSVQPFVKQRFPNSSCSAIPDSFNLTDKPSYSVVKCSIPFCRGPADQPPTIAYSGSRFTFDVGQRVLIKPVLGVSVVEVLIAPALSSGLVLDRKSGEIGGTPTGESRNQSYTITAKNQAGMPAATTLNLEIKSPPAASSPGTPTHTQRSGFSSHKNLPMHSAPAVAPPKIAVQSSFRFNLKDTIRIEFRTQNVTDVTVSPPLPAGLTLDARAGVITGRVGTPTKGRYVLTAKNSTGQPAKAVFSLMINPEPIVAPVAPVVSPPSIYLKTNSYSFEVQKPVLIEPQIQNALSVSVSPLLPKELSFDPKTGVIKGQVTSPVSQTKYVLTALNSAKVAATVGFVLEIVGTSPKVSIKSSSFVHTVGDEISIKPTLDGTVTSVSITPSLKTGIKLDTATGEILGKATEAQSRTTYRLQFNGPSGTSPTYVEFHLEIAPQK